MAVARAVQVNAPGHWKLLGEEVAWSRGFADVVAWNRQHRILSVLECKRVKDATLVFPVDSNGSENRNGLRIESLRCPKCPSFEDHEHGPNLTSRNVTMAEPSFEAHFCVVPRNKGFASLEPLCSELIASGRELGEAVNLQHGHEVILFPMVVTNARLAVCAFDPAQVNLAAGDVLDGRVRDVSFIRYRKSFYADGGSPQWVPPLYDDFLGADADRSVLIVNSERLVWLLGQIEQYGARPVE